MLRPMIRENAASMKYATARVAPGRSRGKIAGCPDRRILRSSAISPPV
jgi:hypothetical protein